MTWQEVLNSNHKTVTVQSYGYEERSFIGRHFEPFKTKRSFKFRIDRNFKMLDHNWLFLEDPEEELIRRIVGNHLRTGDAVLCQI